MNSTGAMLVTSSQLLTEGRGLFYGFFGFVNDAADTIKIYDGLDAGSGRLLAYTELGENTLNPLLLPVGIEFGNGLYIELSATDSRITVLYAPERGYTAPTVESVAQALLDLLGK